MPVIESGIDVAGFQGEGFVVASQIFDLSEVACCRDRVTELVANRPPMPRMKFSSALSEPRPELLPRNPMAVHHVTNLALAGPEWLELSASLKVADRVAALIGKSVDFDMAFLRLRPPRLALPVPWHRDIETDRFENDEAVTVLICLDNMTSQNGSTRVVSNRHGHHRTPLGD